MRIGGVIDCRYISANATMRTEMVAAAHGEVIMTIRDWEWDGSL